jgi:hypothetical protein
LDHAGAFQDHQAGYIRHAFRSNVSLINSADLGDNGSDVGPRKARPFSFAGTLTNVAIPSQVGFKFLDNDPKQTRGKRISNLP